METIGQILRNKRQELGRLLRQVSAYVDIDQAILSKIERNERKPTKEMLEKLAEILKLDKDELLVQYISDKIVYEIANEDCANKALKVAKEIRYSNPTQFKKQKLFGSRKTSVVEESQFAVKFYPKKETLNRMITLNMVTFFGCGGMDLGWLVAYNSRSVQPKHFDIKKC